MAVVDFTTILREPNTNHFAQEKPYFAIFVPILIHCVCYVLSFWNCCMCFFVWFFFFSWTFRRFFVSWDVLAAISKGNFETGSSWFKKIVANAFTSYSHARVKKILGTITVQDETLLLIKPRYLQHRRCIILQPDANFQLLQKISVNSPHW